jgi:hypothetical protein
MVKSRPEPVGSGSWLHLHFTLYSCLTFYMFFLSYLLHVHSITTLYNSVEITYTGVNNLAQVAHKCSTAACRKEPNWRLPAPSLDPVFDVSSRNAI